MKELIEELKAFIEFHAELSAQIGEAFNPNEITMTIKGSDIQSLIDFYEQHYWRKVEDGLPDEHQYLELEVIDGTGLTYISAIRDGKFCDGHGRYIASAIYWRPITPPK